MNMTQGHLNKTTGDIDFPLWAKVIAGIIGICMPLGITVVGWLVVQTIEMRADLRNLGNDKFTRTEFVAFVGAQTERDSMQNERLRSLEDYHRGGQYRE